jgi:hypothetical protein
MKTGDTVRLTFAGRTVRAQVALAAANGRSLALRFDGVLGGYVRTLLLLRDEGGAYRDLCGTEPAIIEEA